MYNNTFHTVKLDIPELIPQLVSLLLPGKACDAGTIRDVGEMLDVIVKYIDKEYKIVHTPTSNLSPSSLSKERDNEPNPLQITTNKTKGHKKPRNDGAREFDITKYHQRHVALEVLYFGWNYHGFAHQKAMDATVESRIFEALKQTRLISPVASWEDCGYSRCGRTDRGVTAFGQVVALMVRSKAQRSTACLPPVSEELDYVGVLNRALPPDIRVRAWAPISSPDFSARFSCQWRQYKYYFHLSADMDLDRIRQAADLLVGEHDFRNFCKMDAANVHNFRRRILSSHVLRVNQEGSGAGQGYPMYCWVVKGSAFLWHQVRCMVAVLFMVGRGLEEPQVVTQLLNLQEFPRKPQYNMASDAPLVLFKCGFEGLQFHNGPPGTHAALISHLDTLREHMAIRATQLHTAVLECQQQNDLAHGEETECEPHSTGEVVGSMMETDDTSTLSDRNTSVGTITRERPVLKLDFHSTLDHNVLAVPNSQSANNKASHHVLLRQRPTEATYEERLNSISSKGSVMMNA